MKARQLAPEFCAGKQLASERVVPYLPHVTNRERALGGSDAQSIKDAKLRTTHHLSSRWLAVT